MCVHVDMWVGSAGEGTQKTDRKAISKNINNFLDAKYVKMPI